MIVKCPDCEKDSLMKHPGARIVCSPGNYTIATEHSWKCLNKECKYDTGTIRVYLKKESWLKRILK